MRGIQGLFALVRQLITEWPVGPIAARTPALAGILPPPGCAPPDACVRAEAAEGLQCRRWSGCADEVFVEVGIAWVHTCAGRLLHWCHEGPSPRVGAVPALFAASHIPDGDRMLSAMLAESIHAKVVCGKSGEPYRFSITQLRSAAGAAAAFPPRSRSFVRPGRLAERHPAAIRAPSWMKACPISRRR
jgi:hypothetical protein